MQRNIYLAYALWFFSAPIGSGLHRIYCGKFFSGILQILIYWVGYFTFIFIIGYIFWAVWGLWWLMDAYFTQFMVEEKNQSIKIEDEYEAEEKFKKIHKLFEMYEKGIISKEEYEIKKEIILR